MIAALAVVWLLVAYLWQQGPDQSLAKEGEIPEILTIEQPIEASQGPEIECGGQQEINKYRAYDDIPLDPELQIYMQEQCDEMDICFKFALALMESESSFQIDAVGDGGNSIGLFQINRINWARMEEMGIDVNTPEGNIKAGLTMLQELFEKHDDVYWVIICYKAGEYRGQKLWEDGCFITKDYDCPAICRRAEEIEREHNK